MARPVTARPVKGTPRIPPTESTKQLLSVARRPRGTPYRAAFLRIDLAQAAQCTSAHEIRRAAALRNSIRVLPLPGNGLTPSEGRYSVLRMFARTVRDP